MTLLLGNTFHARNVVASVMVMIWATRLAGFLFFRVLKRGSDSRFDEIRSHFFKFLGFWIAQIIWVWVVSLPLTILNSPAVSDTRNQGSNPRFGTSRDIAGIILWSLGFLTEAIADAQKYWYKESNSVPRDMPVNKGLWAWSRHPPYFGEMLCWWGTWVLCLSPKTDGRLPPSATAAINGAVISPVFTVILLMFGSGIPTAEKPQARKVYLMAFGPRSTEQRPAVWNQYIVFRSRTSILIPLPPALYSRIPELLKKTIFLDFPMYEFREKDKLEALQDVRDR